MLCKPLNILLERFILSSVQAGRLVIQIEEDLVLIAELVKNVIIAVFGFI